MDREFNPRENPELILSPGAYVRYKHGREIVLSDLTVAEIVRDMENHNNRFFVEEARTCLESNHK